MTLLSANHEKAVRSRGSFPSVHEFWGYSVCKRTGIGSVVNANARRGRALPPGVALEFAAMLSDGYVRRYAPPDACNGSVLLNHRWEEWERER